MLFARSTQDKHHGSGQIFNWLYNPFRGNVQIHLQIATVCSSKTSTVSRVACKEKVDVCKFLNVQKFVKGVWVLTPIFPSTTPIPCVFPQMKYLFLFNLYKLVDK